MIYDMTDILLQLGQPYTLVRTSSFTHQGMTYAQPGAQQTVVGVMVPLTSDERVELHGLGYEIAGKMNFYVPTRQGRLHTNDVIIDSLGIEWVVEPYNSDYTDAANVVKYRLDRRLL